MMVLLHRKLKLPNYLASIVLLGNVRIFSRQKAVFMFRAFVSPFITIYFRGLNKIGIAAELYTC
jgi:hypothetical protein